MLVLYLSNIWPDLNNSSPAQYINALQLASSLRHQPSGTEELSP
jgi:hypothetical protein